MNSYIESEVRRILDIRLNKSLKWLDRLPKGLTRLITRGSRGEIIKVRYTAKGRGRTGAAVRFHLMEAARKRGMV